MLVFILLSHWKIRGLAGEGSLAQKNTELEKLSHFDPGLFLTRKR